jgi:hypothetical protein
MITVCEDTNNPRYCGGEPDLARLPTHVVTSHSTHVLTPAEVFSSCSTEAVLVVHDIVRKGTGVHRRLEGLDSNVDRGLDHRRTLMNNMRKLGNLHILAAMFVIGMFSCFITVKSCCVDYRVIDIVGL